jgi:hypothetical protein
MHLLNDHSKVDQRNTRRPLHSFVNDTVRTAAGVVSMAHDWVI